MCIPGRVAVNDVMCLTPDRTNDVTCLISKRETVTEDIIMRNERAQCLH